MISTAKRMLTQANKSFGMYEHAIKLQNRICFGSESYERIDEAMDRIEKYLATL